MEWLFDRRGKSLALSAQRIVTDMHRHLDLEKKRNKELEEMIIKFQHLCTESIDNEIYRLEVRKKDLQTELDLVETSLSIKRLELEKTREDVRSILTSRDSDDPATSKESLLIGSSLVSKEKSDALEEQYLEETELFVAARDMSPNTLFIIHRNDSEDVIGYNPSSNQSSELVICSKIEHLNSLESISLSSHSRPSTVSLTPSISPLSLIESMMSFGARIVPNHDRDYPDVKEITVPAYLLTPFLPTQKLLPTQPKSSPSASPSSSSVNLLSFSSHSPSPLSSSTHSHSHSGFFSASLHPTPPSASTLASTPVVLASLVGAFEIPLIPDVVIDLWSWSPPPSPSPPSPPPQLFWASTSINGLSFAVLERFFVTSQLTWGVSSAVTKIDIFGRHPKNGHLLMESIVASSE